MLPYISSESNNELKLLSFKGLDMRPNSNYNTLSAMENMGAESYPALSPRAPRRLIKEVSDINTFVAPVYDGSPLEDFTGVRNNSFYYRGTKIDGTLSDGEKSIADFNGKICIFPDKVYYDYLPHSETGNLATSLTSMEKTLSLTDLKFVSYYDEDTGDYTNYVYKSGGGFDIFKPGESIIIEGCAEEVNNTYVLNGCNDYAPKDAIVSAVVEDLTKSRLYLSLYSKTGKKLVFTECDDDDNEVTIKSSVPDMNHICVHNNRLWGTSSNGQYIYASKLGDCTNFNSFEGLSDDSWYSKIGTGGSFTGICSYRSSVIAFKETCIHHIYGDSPRNFAIPKHTYTGCIDGRSIAEVGGILYFLSTQGFYAYSGGEPYHISPQITTKYSSCVGGSDNKNYYASAYNGEGYDLLVYNPTLNTWHRQDSLPILNFIPYNTGFYCATKDAIYQLNAGSENVSWSFTTQPITCNTGAFKGVNALYLRADTFADTEITVFISYDNGEFKKTCSLSKGKAFRNHRIPIKFRHCDSFKIKVEGKGNATIYDLELITYQGGKTYEL